MRKWLSLLYLMMIAVGAVGLPAMLVFLQYVQWYEVLILSLLYSSLILAGGLGLFFMLRKERQEG
ncbi:MAG: hypothetical protein B9J98_04275 [Candidatus Terraquivivens tikiterensis]|uniref:Uncharacterized protein n=1 Tax=Candidatus Terraquivivens tikiterensis TaxID=1980982 RepID=A0A2R7Y3F1_9ARCH|nr:MAG: hypothetical protein B9J98_04275 [Candidatus Terraquivivens tikiterensis]